MPRATDICVLRSIEWKLMLTEAKRHLPFLVGKLCLTAFLRLCQNGFVYIYVFGCWNLNRIFNFNCEIKWVLNSFLKMSRRKVEEFVMKIGFVVQLQWIACSFLESTKSIAHLTSSPRVFCSSKIYYSLTKCIKNDWYLSIVCILKDIRASGIYRRPIAGPEEEVIAMLSNQPFERGWFIAAKCLR